MTICWERVSKYELPRTLSSNDAITGRKIRDSKPSSDKFFFNVIITIIYETKVPLDFCLKILIADTILLQDCQIIAVLNVTY